MVSHGFQQITLQRPKCKYDVRLGRDFLPPHPARQPNPTTNQPVRSHCPPHTRYVKHVDKT